MTLAPPVDPLPIWVRNASPVALRLAARFGLGWFPPLVPPEAAAGTLRLGRLAEEHGRPPSTSRPRHQGRR